MKSTKTKSASTKGKVEPQKTEGIPPDVLDRLLALLETKGVRQTDFAAAMGRSNDWASRTMKGERGLLVETLVKLATAYDENLHWLVTGKGEMFAPVDGKGSTTQILDDAIVRLKLLRESLTVQP